MNFDKLFAWIVPIVIAAAISGNINSLQRWIWTAQAKLVVESRASTWGSPRFFPDRPFSNASKDSVSSRDSKKEKN